MSPGDPEQGGTDMKLIGEYPTGKVYESNDATVKMGIFKDDVQSKRDYYHVMIAWKGVKNGKTVASRCTWQKAMAIAESYDQ